MEDIVAGSKKDLNDDERMMQTIHDLILSCGGDPNAFEGELISQLIQTSLRLLSEGHDTGQLKLINRSLKEMRYAYRIFNQYSGQQRVSIFGSARTPEDHPDYLAAKAFSASMAHHGWMCITGAANGIMKAGLEGPKKESAFGLSIRLPFENQKPFLEGDPKLIIFRYFFTRKLMFMSHSDAVAAFPGGVGTLDELFEVLTLMQTGKAKILPIVLVEGAGGVYWQYWLEYVKDHLLANGWVGKDDLSLFYLAKNAEDAVEHVLQFYRNYHSSRYVKDKLVIRLKKPVTEEQLELLNEKFSRLLIKGTIENISALQDESDVRELPRIAFEHTHRDFGTLREMIDQINLF